MNDKQQDLTIVTPLSVTDVVKSVREILGLVRDATGMVIATGGAYQRHKGRKTAGSVDVLAFKTDGSRKHLERIIDGTATIGDFEAIATRMNQTGGSVEDAIDHLRENRKFIRERFGMAVANQIDEIIYAKSGKASIRLDLEQLARMDDTFYSPEDIANEAKRILDNIKVLNAKLEMAHDTLIELEKKA